MDPMAIYDTMIAIFIMIYISLKSWFDNISISRGFIVKHKTQKKRKPIKVGLLTNEIHPVIYGGVATWIVNFIKMFEGDERGRSGTSLYRI